MKLKTYALVSTALVGFFTTAAAFAQTATNPAASGQSDATEVVVTGFRKSLATALNAKKHEDRISDGISSEDLGKFPSENIAEAIQRIPGVQMADVNGRGATISIRGLGPQYAMTTVNGQAFKSPDFTDGFRYDVIQTELASAVQVYKSPSADMDAGGLAGTVNIETVKPLDQKGRHIVVSVKAQESQLARGNATPKGSISYLDHFDDGKIGVFLGASYQELTDRADYFWIDRWVNPDGSAFNTARRPRYRRIDRDTLRQQFNAAVQYRPIDGLEMGLTAIYSKDNTRYDVNQQVFLFNTSRIQTLASTADTATVIKATDFTMENNRQLETRNLKTSAFTYDMKWTGNPDWKVTSVLHYTQGEAHLTEEAAILGINIASATLDMSDPSDVKFDVSTNLSDPSVYALDTLTRNEYPDGAQHHDLTDQAAGQIDVTRYIDKGLLHSLSGGVKIYRETFSRYSTRRDLDGNLDNSVSPLMTASNELVSGFLDGNDSIQTSWVAPDTVAYRAALAAANINVPKVFDPSGSYGVIRNVASAYLMANFSGEVAGLPVHGDVGVRDEQTHQLVKGYLSGDANPLNSNVNLAIGTYQTPMSYSNVLPSGNLVVDITPNLLLRAAAAKVLVRPILDSRTQLTTTVSSSVDANNVRNFTISEGSATLKPLTADQFDLGLEWYYGHNNGLSVAGFVKNVKNGTFTASNLCPASFNGTALSLVSNECVDSSGSTYLISQTLNDSSVVKIKGFEVNWEQSFDQWLPVKGFGVTSNYTHVTPSSKKTGFYLANLSKDTVNLTTYWENSKFSARISANYRSAYNQTSAESFFATENHTIEGRTQYDITLGYNINDRLSVSFGGLNVTNALEKAYKDIKSRWQMTSVVGPSYYLSLQYKM
jgi:TonB-dependent receptor